MWMWYHNGKGFELDTNIIIFLEDKDQCDNDNTPVSGREVMKAGCQHSPGSLSQLNTN